MPGKPGTRKHKDWDLYKIRSKWMMGMTWAEIAKEHHTTTSTIMTFTARHSKRLGYKWPMERNERIHRRVRTEASRRRVRSVDCSIIIELLEEYLEENNVTMAEFVKEKLGIVKNTQINQFYEYRTGRKQRISGDRAVAILQAIGEPVPITLLPKKRKSRARVHQVEENAA